MTIEKISTSEKKLKKTVSKLIEDAYSSRSNLQLIAPTGSSKTHSGMKVMYRELIDDSSYRTVTLALPFKSLLTEKYFKFIEEFLKNRPELKQFVALNRMFYFHKPLANVKFTTYDTLYSEITLNSSRRPLLFASNDDTIISDEAHTTLDSEQVMFMHFINMMNHSMAHKIIMTATMPTGVIEFIDKHVINNKFYNDAGKTYIITTERFNITEATKTFIQNTINDYKQVSVEITEENKHKKTLFIFNTIKKASAVYSELASTLYPEENQEYLIYKFMVENGVNSIFDLAFDKNLQELLIDYLRKKCKIILLTSLQPQFLRNILEKLVSIKNNLRVIVSTQVVEIGFDDKNVSHVVTEVAPVSSLVQRFGRIRVKGKVNVLIPDKYSYHPYLMEEYSLVYDYLKSISDDDLTSVINDLLSYSEEAQKVIDMLSVESYRSYSKFKRVYSETVSTVNNSNSFRNDKIVFVLPTNVKYTNYRKYKDLIIQMSLSSLKHKIKTYGINYSRLLVEKFNHNTTFTELNNIYKLNTNDPSIKSVILLISQHSYINLFFNITNLNPTLL